MLAFICSLRSEDKYVSSFLSKLSYWIALLNILLIICLSHEYLFRYWL